MKDLPRVRDALKLAHGQEIHLTVLRDGRVMDLKGRQPE